MSIFQSVIIKIRTEQPLKFVAIREPQAPFLNPVYLKRKNQSVSLENKIQVPENQIQSYEAKSKPVENLNPSFEDQTQSFENVKPSMKDQIQNPKNLIQSCENSYAIIVPCYNEEKRFPYQRFLSFAEKHPEVLICFVNDGSKDNTLAVLKGIQSESPENVCVYSLSKNGGKAEAVRQGMLYMHQHFSVQLIGFLDADLATTPEEWLQMAKYKEYYPQYGAIVGSRIQRLGASINRNDSRSLFSSIIKRCIRFILKASFQDTQCGAKIFHRDLVPFLFRQPFMTPWLFDVEIFLRLQKKFGKTTLQNGVLEFPLMNWTEVGDSRLKLKHTIKIPMQLLQLHFQYNLAKKFKTKSGISVFDSQKNSTVLKIAAKHVAALFI